MEASELAGTYDVVICGTGPTESLLSGCLAQAGKKILHLDSQCEYGGCRKTFGLRDLMEWAQTNGEVIVDKVVEKLGENYRNGAYCLDLMPLTIFAYDQLIQIVVDSGNADAINIQLMDGLYFRGQSGFRKIPSSKANIFTDKDIPNRQKRAVMKFIAYFFPELQYGHVIPTSDIETKVNEFIDKPFSDLLNAIGLDGELNSAFEYFVAHASSPILTKEAVPRIREFCKSIGRYGETPLLAFLYGASDFPQIYCRHSAVYGGTFVLNHKPENLQETDDGFTMDVKDIGTITAKCVISAIDQLLPETSEKKTIAKREIILTTKSLFEKNRSIAVIPPGMMDTEKPVYVFQFDYSLRTCQEDQYVIHLVSMSDVRKIGDQLVSEIGEEEVIARVSFDVTEKVGELPNKVIGISSPSAADLIIGTNFFLQQSTDLLEVIKKLFGEDFPFYPAPTEVEIPIEEEPIQIIPSPSEATDNQTNEESKPTEKESEKTEEGAKNNDNTETPGEEIGKEHTEDQAKDIE